MIAKKSWFCGYVCLGPIAISWIEFENQIFDFHHIVVVPLPHPHPSPRSWIMNYVCIMDPLILAYALWLLSQKKSFIIGSIQKSYLKVLISKINQVANFFFFLYYHIFRDENIVCFRYKFWDQNFVSILMWDQNYEEMV